MKKKKRIWLGRKKYSASTLQPHPLPHTHNLKVKWSAPNSESTMIPNL